jgi:hypothetical protein
MLLAHRYKQTQMVVALPGHSQINNYMMFELAFASYLPPQPQNYESRSNQNLTSLFRQAIVQATKQTHNISLAKMSFY